MQICNIEQNSKILVLVKSMCKTETCSGTLTNASSRFPLSTPGKSINFNVGAEAQKDKTSLMTNILFQ